MKRLIWLKKPFAVEEWHRSEFDGATGLLATAYTPEEGQMFHPASAPGTGPPGYAMFFGPGTTPHLDGNGRLYQDAYWGIKTTATAYPTSVRMAFDDSAILPNANHSRIGIDLCDNGVERIHVRMTFFDNDPNRYIEIFHFHPGNNYAGDRISGPGLTIPKGGIKNLWIELTDNIGTGVKAFTVYVNGAAAYSPPIDFPYADLGNTFAFYSYGYVPVEQIIIHPTLARG